MRYVLPIIIASLLGVKPVNIYHLKLNSEDQQSSYDIESAQDDQQGQDLEAAKEPKSIPFEIDEVKGQIQDLKDDINQEKQKILDSKKLTEPQQQPQDVVTQELPLAVKPATQDGPDQVAIKANGYNATFGITKVVNQKKYNDKGLEKDKMMNDIRQKYINPGHSEGIFLRPKTEAVKAKKTIVHIVPYSKTSSFKKPIDDQFSGTNNMLQKGFARMILESVVEELDQHPDRRFTFSEVKMLQMWYTRTTQENRDRLKKVIQNGQFEVATGGWSTTDEVCPNFEDLINNVMIGHQFLQNEFGYTPRIGWNLEAFGHSNTNARLFAQLGFDAQFFTNVDQQLKEKFKAEDQHKLNFLWQPASTNFGDKYQILTSILKDSHKFPGGFYADSGPDVDFTPIVTDKERSDYNAPDRSNQFINYVNEIAAAYQEDNILYPMGTEFSYQNAGQTYKNIEKMIDWINENQCDSQIIYKMSTPSEYIKAINEEKKSYSIFKNDMGTFVDQKQQAFSGFFTSKAAYKKQIRDSSSLFHMHQKQLAQTVLRTDVNEEQVSNILKSKDLYLDALGVANDQFSITGGLRDIVEKDDERRLNEAREMSSSLFKKEILDQTKILLGKNITELSQCQNGPSNGNDTVLQCPINQHKNASDFLLIIKNPKVIGNRNSYVKIMLDGKNYKSQRWNSTLKQFTDVESDIFEQTHYDYNNKESVDYQMFIPGSFRPGQIVIYQIVKVSEAEQAKIEASLVQMQDSKTNQTKTSSLSVLGIGPQNDILFNYIDEGVNQTFGVNLKYYQGHSISPISDNQMKENEKNHVIDKETSDPEGIWTFKPEFGSEPKQYSNSSNDGSNVVYQQGQYIDQYSITFQSTTKDGRLESSAVIRVRFSPKLFKSLIQFDVEIGTIQICDGLSKDVTVNWKMYDDFDPKGIFWTDSNGLEMQRRKIIDFQDHGIKAARNYYPVDSAIAIRDELKHTQVTIMNNRPQGGSADLSDKANIEIIQHRRTATVDRTLDTDFALDETDGKDGPGIKINAEYNMQIFNFESGKSIQREQQIINDQPMEYFFSFDKVVFDKAPAVIARTPEQKCSYEPKHEECSQKAPEKADVVKDAIITHRVIKQAPTYIKQAPETKGFSNPVQEKPQEQPVVENQEAHKTETAIKAVHYADTQPSEKVEFKETEIVENKSNQNDESSLQNLQVLTKTEKAKEKTISEEISSAINTRIQDDITNGINQQPVESKTVVINEFQAKSNIYESEDFKFAPVSLNKADESKGMLYKDAGDIQAVQSSEQNVEPVQNEAKETFSEQESLLQLSKSVDEIDDGTSGGKIDQEVESYDNTEAAIAANENAQTNQQQIDSDDGANENVITVDKNGNLIPTKSTEAPTSNETGPQEFSKESVPLPDQMTKEKKVAEVPKYVVKQEAPQQEKAKKSNEKVIDVTVDIGGNKTADPKPAELVSKTSEKIAKLLSKLPKYAKNVSISINPINKGLNLTRKELDVKKYSDAQSKIEAILKDLKEQVGQAVNTNPLLEKYPFNTPIDISQGNMFTKNFRGFTYQLFPLAKNKVLVRLENLLDKFDVSNSETKYFDMVLFAKELWWHSQLTSKGISTQPQAHIQEMSINGASSIESSQQRFKWISVDGDCNSGKNKIGNDDAQDKNNLRGVALNPQSIRTFMIDYNEPKPIQKEEETTRPVEKVLKRAAEERIKVNINNTRLANQTGSPINQTQAKFNVTAPTPAQPQAPNAKQINIEIDLGSKKEQEQVVDGNKNSTNDTSSKANLTVELDGKKQVAEPNSKRVTDTTPGQGQGHLPTVIPMEQKQKSATTKPLDSQKWKEVKAGKYTPLKDQLKAKKLPLK